MYYSIWSENYEMTYETFIKKFREVPVKYHTEKIGTTKF